ncbi:aminoglycoside N(3)-acetyltransferase [Campylobacter coli]|nr:aminoglycoside N(3)-acetyltransferase [Campylobacter coli]EAH8899348.1 aminoglycoside N(3)-acetyltransferase [Campylobacter coli]EAI7174590.1 aminoglycoside N(3)-acetyltransferase [Campylobacter coli]EAJ2630225.1 aminoglycoside N(3)-acetyltransferase [Campylobacter coli]EAK3200416.1 aminoglycoside N(3)-acetyltransferase [Campylobacter coli]
MKELFQCNQKIYTQRDLVDTLRNIGIKNGDIICVHTEIFHFQTPLLSKNEFLNSLIESLFTAIGKEGTLIMPTFTYSFCKNEVYDKLNSKCTVGILNEFFRKQKCVKRTNDPIFSFAIKGIKEDLFLHKEQKSCFDENCVYNTLKNNNGKIVLLGTQLLGYTFTHFIEEQAQVPYRYFKPFEGDIIYENNNKKTCKINYYVRDLQKKSEVSILKQIALLKNSNNFKLEKIANAEIVSIDCQVYFDETMKALKQDPYCLLKD